MVWQTIRRLRYLAGYGTLLCRDFQVDVRVILHVVVVAESVWHKP